MIVRLGFFLFLNINCVLEITLYEHIRTPSSPQQHSIRTAWCRTSLEGVVTAVAPCVLPGLVMRLQAVLIHHDCACCLLLGLYVL